MSNNQISDSLGQASRTNSSSGPNAIRKHAVRKDTDSFAIRHVRKMMTQSNTPTAIHCLPKPTKPIVTSKQLTTVTAHVFASMLELELGPMSPTRRLRKGFPHWLHATIGIEGDWNAKLIVAVPISLAQRIARSIFLIGTDRLTESEISDAFGEVVNVIGGNIVSKVSSNCKLGIPVVSRASESLCRINNVTDLECDALPLQIGLTSR